MTVIVRLLCAVLVGGLLVEASHTRADGYEELPIVLTVIAGLLATFTVVAAVLEARMDRRHAHREARTWRRRARSAELANETLLETQRVWRRRAIHWQTLYDAAETDTETAMLHTPLGDTLLDVWELPDTRERAS